MPNEKDDQGADILQWADGEAIGFEPFDARSESGPEWADADAVMSELVPATDPLPGFRAPLAQRAVAYGQLAFGAPLQPQEWMISPVNPFRPSHLLTWLADGHSGSGLSSLRIAAEENFALHPVPAMAFLARMGIESFVGHFLRCSGDGACVYCQALQRRPPVLELLAAELQRMPAAVSIDLRTVSIGERLQLRHGVLQGFMFLGWEILP